MVDRQKQLAAKEFAARMKMIAESDDMESGRKHDEADDLMCAVLTMLGFGEGVKVFADMERWYA